MSSFNNPKTIKNGKRCGIIFKRENRYLVVCGRSTSCWSFPKGRYFSKDETKEECAIRETKEETGIEVSKEDLLDKRKIKIKECTYFIWENYIPKQNETYEYKDDYEVAEVAWKTRDELKDLRCNFGIRSFLHLNK